MADETPPLKEIIKLPELGGTKRDDFWAVQVSMDPMTLHGTYDIVQKITERAAKSSSFLGKKVSDGTIKVGDERILFRTTMAMEDVIPLLVAIAYTQHALHNNVRGTTEGAIRQYGSNVANRAMLEAAVQKQGEDRATKDAADAEGDTPPATPEGPQPARKRRPGSWGPPRAARPSESPTDGRSVPHNLHNGQKGEDSTGPYVWRIQPVAGLWMKIYENDDVWLGSFEHDELVQIAGHGGYHMTSVQIDEILKKWGKGPIPASPSGMVELPSTALALPNITQMQERRKEMIKTSNWKAKPKDRDRGDFYWGTDNKGNPRKMYRQPDGTYNPVAPPKDGARQHDEKGPFLWTKRADGLYLKKYDNGDQFLFTEDGKDGIEIVSVSIEGKTRNAHAVGRFIAAHGKPKAMEQIKEAKRKRRGWAPRPGSKETVTPEELEEQQRLFKLERNGNWDWDASNSPVEDEEDDDLLLPDGSIKLMDDDGKAILTVIPDESVSEDKVLILNTPMKKSPAKILRDLEQMAADKRMEEARARQEREADRLADILEQLEEEEEEAAGEEKDDDFYDRVQKRVMGGKTPLMFRNELVVESSILRRQQSVQRNSLWKQLSRDGKHRYFK